MKYDLYLKNFVGDPDFDADYVEYVLARREGEEVHVLINSLGGSLQAALTISSAFRRHGNVHVHYTGMNASAATIASLGAKYVTMDAHAFYLIHKCSLPVFEWANLNADEFRLKISEYQKTVADLEKLDLSIADMYATRCKKPVADLIRQMEHGGWLTAQEALDFGFVDQLTADTGDAVSVSASLVASMQQAGIPVPEAYQPADNLQNLCRIIGVPQIEFCDDATALTRSELLTVEKTIAQLEQQRTDLQAAVAEAEQRIEALTQQRDALQTERDALQARLDNRPADEPEQVITQRTEPVALNEQYEALRAARQLYNSI